VDTGFRKRSCSNKKIKRNAESTKNHFALDAIGDFDRGCSLAPDCAMRSGGFYLVKLVIASEAKQSRAYAEELDCFVAIAPRNDETKRQLARLAYIKLW
jgi:hypothetical protein